jgi:hypothetical protein
VSEGTFFLLALSAVVGLLVFALVVPLPMRCERRWCFGQPVGLSIYCRKHTDEILRDKEPSEGREAKQ